MMNVLTNLIVVIILQYTHTSDHHVGHVVDITQCYMLTVA